MKVGGHDRASIALPASASTHDQRKVSQLRETFSVGLVFLCPIVINSALQTGSSEGIALLDKAITEGDIDQDIVVIQKQRLDQIVRQAHSQRAITKRLQKELLNTEGELEATTLSQESNSLQYTIMVIVGIIVAGLTVKTITSNDVSMLDNAILAIAIGVIVYFLIKKLM